MSRSLTLMLGALALALMILLPSLLIMKAIYDRAHGVVWQIDMAGFDPRDLLRGHYLNFTYDWNYAGGPESQSCEYGKKCCLCLNEASPGNNVSPRVTTLSCDASEARQCTSKIVGGKSQNSFATNGQVYFIPEKYAYKLETLLREGKNDFKMEIAVPRSGGPAIIRKLYIDQKPLEVFLTGNP